MAKAKFDPTRIDDPSKASSNWLSIVEDVFPRWRDRLGSSKDARDELEALLRERDPETRSAIGYVDASGTVVPNTSEYLDAGFWRDRLLLVPDANGGADHLAVDYTPPVHVEFDLPEGGHWVFDVRRLDVERWEGLYFPMTPVSPPAQGSSAQAEPPRKRGRKESIQWGLIKTEMLALMDHHGDFNPADSEWDAQARLEEALKQYCQDQFIEEPSDGALRQKLPDWLDEWRSRKLQGISTSS